MSSKKVDNKIEDNGKNPKNSTYKTDNINQKSDNIQLSNIQSDVTQDNPKSENSNDKKLITKRELSDEKKFKIFVFIGVAVIIASLIVGSYINLYWISLVGSLIGIFIVLGSTFTHIIKIFLEIRKEQKEKNDLENTHEKQNLYSNQNELEKYYLVNNDNNQASEIANEVHSKSINTKKQIETAKKKIEKNNKLIIKRFVSVMVICFLIIVVGISINGITNFGFVLLGIGIVGIIGMLLFIITKNIYDRKKYLKYLSVDKSLLKEFYDIRVGVCAKCIPHSQSYSKKEIRKGVNIIYSVWVLPLDGVDILHINVEEPDFDKSNQLVMLSRNKYEVGDKVRFYQNKSNNKDCYTIE